MVKSVTKRGVLQLGDAAFDVYVLETGARVCTQRTLVKSLGGSGGKLTTLIGEKTAGALDLGEGIRFQTLDGIQALGRQVGDIGKLCAQIVELQMAGVLPPEKIDLARAANRLNAVLAGIALEALVDEVTGYQEVRAGDYLRSRLQFALREEMDEWQRMWKRATFQSICAVYGRRYLKGAPPRWLSAIIDKIHRRAFGEDVARALRDLNPDPKFKSNHHQLLTDPVRRQFAADLAVVEALARISVRDRAGFWRRVDRYFGRDEDSLTGQEVLVD